MSDASPTRLDRLWAGWRTEYVSGATAPGGADDCVFCGIQASGLPDDETYIVWRGRGVVALLNAYPYTSGHMLLMPARHVAEMEDLTADESSDLWRALVSAVRALKGAYRPEALNVGGNLGRAAGAGVPGHFHLHALPRWSGDTNFMTALAETRVLPETLSASWKRLRDAWPGDDGPSRST